MYKGLVVSLLFVFSCFPPKYWDPPATGEKIKVKKMMATRSICNYDRSRCSWVRAGYNRTVYSVKDRGFYINTISCKGEGKATITFWEELQFEDGTKCPITQVYIKSIDDFARPRERGGL